MNELSPQKLVETLDTIYQASFVGHQPVHERACLLGLLEHVHGEDHARQIMQQVKHLGKCPMLEPTNELASAEHK